MIILKSIFLIITVYHRGLFIVLIDISNNSLIINLPGKFVFLFHTWHHVDHFLLQICWQSARKTLRINQIGTESFRLEPDLMIPVSESNNFGLNGGAVSGSIDFFGHVTIQVQVGQDQVGHVVVGEGLVARDLKFKMMVFYLTIEILKSPQNR